MIKICNNLVFSSTNISKRRIFRCSGYRQNVEIRDILLSTGSGKKIILYNAGSVQFVSTQQVEFIELDTMGIMLKHYGENLGANTPSLE